MRSLLLVDDEVYTVQGILDAIDWEQIGIGPVYPAYSMQQAVAVFEAHPVDILLCDIEMPQGSGIDLLEWVTVNSPGTVSLLLTCHADFIYAQQAMKLGCSDYLLKPVPYEKLEIVLAGIVKKADQAHLTDENNQLGRLWRKNEPFIRASFWTSLLQATGPVRFGELQAGAQRHHIRLEPDMQYLPVLFTVRERSPALDDWETDTLVHAVCNLAAELVLPEDAEIPALSLASATYVLLFQRVGHERAPSLFPDDACASACTSFMETASQILTLRLACYAGQWSSITSLPAALAALQDVDRQNVAYFGEVILPDTATWMKDTPEMPDTLQWKSLLLSGSTRRFLQEAVHCLDDWTAQRRMNASVLAGFFQNLLQVIHIVLSEKGILGNQLQEAEADWVFTQRLTTVAEARIALHRILTSVERHLEKARGNVPLVEQVKRHIREHMEEDPTCEQIGERFFMHPDHLTRLLKKETGVSLLELIVQERMSAAQELLDGTKLSIAQIAAQVGYTNVSHFTRMFRRTTGLNPLSWRQHSSERHLGG